jgi:hypothetical protein
MTVPVVQVIKWASSASGWCPMDYEGVGEWVVVVVVVVVVVDL